MVRVSLAANCGSDGKNSQNSQTLDSSLVSKQQWKRIRRKLSLLPPDLADAAEPPKEEKIN